MRMLALLLVIVSSQLFAQPVITSVTPPSSPVSGQTEVTIRGSNFSNICPPGFPCTTREPQAFFGGTSALSTRLVDANTIIAVAPPHLPGASFITVSQPNGASSIRFSYEGDPSEAFDPILIPLLTPPVNGAFGSRFVPEFQILNTGTRQVQAYGLKTFFCTGGLIILPVPADPRDDPLVLTPRSEPQCVDRTGNPGRLVWVPKGTTMKSGQTANADDIAATAKPSVIKTAAIRRLTRSFRMNPALPTMWRASLPPSRTS